MFKFEKISDFDFNKINESSLHHLNFSLDDFDDEDVDITQMSQTSSKVKQTIDFDTFLYQHIFNPIEMLDKVNNSNDIKYAWKEYPQDGNTHYLAYIEITQNNKKEYKKYYIYIDLNNNTKELHIGNCNSYGHSGSSRYMSISYPLIKICETYANGPVYIGDIYLDLGFGINETAESLLNKIKTPLEFIGISQEISIYRCIWNNKNYYYPFNGLNKKGFTEIDNAVKIPHNFVEHLKGFSGNLSYSITNLYYNAFDNWYDFLKMVVLICDSEGVVKTDFNYQFTPENYEEKLQEFKELVESEIGNIEEEKIQAASYEEKCKQKIQEMFSETVITNYDEINRKLPNYVLANKKLSNYLTTRILNKERTSTDPYRKFDLPVIDLILKDNGINVDKLVEEYEADFLDNLYKFINLLDEHFDRIHCSPIAKYYLFRDIFIRGNIKAQYACTEKINNTPTGGFDDETFDGLTKEEIQLMKKLMTGLKVLQIDNQGRCQADVSKLNNKSEESIHLANAVIDCFGEYSNGQIGDIHASKNSTEAEDIHAYNKFALLQRFVYLLSILIVEDHNKTVEEKGTGKTWEYPQQFAVYLYNYNYTRGGYGYPGKYDPLSLGDNWLRIDTYTQLYKFVKMIAYVIENAYNITVPNLGCCDDTVKNQILRAYGELEYKEDLTVNSEFSYDNKPNMNTFNVSSLNTMFETIFKNISDKIDKNKL